MKILFIQRSAFIKLIGLMYISSILKKEGFGCEVIFYKDERFLVEQINSIKPDMIGFSFTTEDYMWVLKTSKIIKKHFNLPIIVGGIHPTLYPEIITDEGIDFVYRGEGGYPLADLIKRLSKNSDFTKISNLWVKKKGKVYKNKVGYTSTNLNKLPFPDRELYLKHAPFLAKLWPSTAIMAGRGCPHSCSFCFNAIFRSIYGKRKYIRQRAVKNILAEVLYLKIKHDMLRLSFVDEHFDKEWLENFLLHYPKELRIPFVINVRIDLLDDNLIYALKKSGCIGVRCGIETYNRMRRMRLFNKNLSNQKILSVANILKKHNLQLLTYYIYGFGSGKKEDEIRKILQFNKKVKADTVRLLPMRHYKLLPLSEKIKKEKNMVLRNYKYFPVSKQSKNSNLQLPKPYIWGILKKYNTYLDIIFNFDHIRIKDITFCVIRYFKRELYHNSA